MHFRALCLTSVLALAASAATADMNFNRIASFGTYLNMADGEDLARTSSAEIIAATADGMTLVYTDSPLGVIGRVDITDPANPAPLGNVALDGEPTAVGIVGSTAFVGVNTSASFTDPSGHLAIIDVISGDITATCDLGGQPDSVAVSKDGTRISIAIENERDEDLGDGRVGQLPAGFLVIGEIKGAALSCDDLVRVEMTGLADIAPEDPEPEFVDINDLGETIVTLQENNYLVIVGADGSIINHFSAGAVDLDRIDTLDERGSLDFDKSQKRRKREPDAVKWIDSDHFAIANEGDMDGGSRGWTIFSKTGDVVYESGVSFEHALIQIGHYPDKRSDAKGVEPESIETAVFDGTPMVFVGSERGSAVGVYDVTDLANPVLKQILPSGIGPEGYVAIPSRNLLISANEEDLIEDGGVRAHVMIFQYQDAEAMYPTLTSEGAEQLIGWGAISGMVADADGIVWAVNDSFYGFQPSIFKIDTTQTPARIVDVIRVHRANGDAAQKLDLEGITLDGHGGFWVASEGRTERGIPHAIYHVTADGLIKTNSAEIMIPAALTAVEKRFGFEGITRVGDTLWMAVQREWKDDPKNHVKLVSYNIETQEWGAVLYPKAEPAKGWVGLSEIVAHGDFMYVIERDNQIGANAVTKKIYRIPMADMQPAALGGDLPVVTKEEVRDLIPDLASYGGYIVDKVEGLAIFPDGTVWVSTDNDGVDDSSGETFFWMFKL
ncbi:Esterase-like activity of phytase [Mameliella alba]|uniref:esterase-like activity of phytase family protein n=1 Tax=Mameliella alba TaxID=561184 RepID=UPI00089119E9|nr:esterase-like activity of phytase family protein [Mameliella alba]OWV47940.1 alkaline phosphatase [Mameliella alba]PTR39663.1 phytase-like protein with esterase activity [Mameliella alba]GGF62572.1 alkaline phosphatase [Mameliella alba]SDD16365.1 Esterase-like activity of phytase [Mameliella alba]